MLVGVCVCVSVLVIVEGEVMAVVLIGQRPVEGEG